MSCISISFNLCRVLQTGYRFDPTLGVLALRVNAEVDTSRAVAHQWARLVLSHLVPDVVLAEDASEVRGAEATHTYSTQTLARQMRVRTAWAGVAPAGDGAQSLLVQWYRGATSAPPQPPARPQERPAATLQQEDSEVSVVHTPFRRWRRAPEIQVWTFGCVLYLDLMKRINCNRESNYGSEKLLHIVRKSLFTELAD